MKTILKTKGAIYFLQTDQKPGALSIQPKIPEISVGTSNGTDHFGLVRPEYSGPALKMVHFNRSRRSRRSDPNVPFHLTKLLSPVSLFCILLKRTITKSAVVCVTGMYSSTGHVKFPKFQTGFFFEWKALQTNQPREKRTSLFD